MRERGPWNYPKVLSMLCNSKKCAVRLKKHLHPQTGDSECKQLLVQEGVRLRTLHEEEVSILRHEALRSQVTLETLRQCDDLGKIMSKNQYEVLHLMEAMEKLRMIEADKDDRGLKDTIDDAGERYVPGKKFKSQEIEYVSVLSTSSWPRST